MTFAGIPTEKQRADVIAYLNTLSAHPLPLPTAKSADAPANPTPSASAKSPAAPASPPPAGAAPAQPNAQAPAPKAQ
jgi:cytochrome c